jgi:hypothetical protein
MTVWTYPILSDNIFGHQQNFLFPKRQSEYDIFSSAENEDVIILLIDI